MRSLSGKVGLGGSVSFSSVVVGVRLMVSTRFRSCCWTYIGKPICKTRQLHDSYQFPAHPLAPLAASPSKYPLIIFSHGLAGTRNTYSNYCAALAASGNVVLAIEHRDGSGPAILNPSSDGRGELMTYLTMEDLRYVCKKKGADG